MKDLSLVRTYGVRQGLEVQATEVLEVHLEGYESACVSF